MVYSVALDLALETQRPPLPFFPQVDSPALVDTVSMDSSSSADARLSTQRMITDGVELVLAIRAAESTLEELNLPHSAPTHNIQYILQAAKIDKLKKAFQEIVGNLAALPHTPVNVKLDLGPLRTWMDANRERFDAFKTFCDEYRPKSPMEEGEVHPDLEFLSSALERIEHRLEDLAPRVNPEAFELQRRAEMLAEGHARGSQIFCDFMAKFDFLELGELGQRLAVEQRVHKAARETLDGMVKMSEGGIEERDAFSWLEPVDPQHDDPTEYDGLMEIVDYDF
ncbi:hypothetical protein B0H17DRAFT_1029668, partial [Mycena rosella]